MALKAHSNPKSLNWLVSLVVMLVLSACVIVSTIFITKAVDKKANAPVEIDFTISSTSPMSVESNELNVTGVEKAVDASGNTVAYVITGTTIGYNAESPIEMATTVTADAAVVCGIDILHQDETEYLGVRIMEDSFQDQFTNRKLPMKANGSMSKGSSVDMIARSTISSQAVIDGVNNAQEYVATFLAE